MTMKRIVRESKFRHLYGNFSPKDKIFDGVVARDSRLDGEIAAVNKYFIAVVLDSSNGFVFTVLNRRKPGRVDHCHRCVGHISEVVDLNFSHHNPLQIVSGADDGSFIVWNLPLEGLTEDLDTYQSILKASQRRAVGSRWHSSAADILIAATTDFIHIFNTLTEEVIRSISTTEFSDQLFNLALNYNSTQCVASFKDKRVRVFDLMTGEKTKEFQTHEGSKPIKVAWITRDFGDKLILTTGATKMSGRQICVWDLDHPEKPLCIETLDNATSPLYIYYDIDTKLIVCYGKGEVSIKLYEFDMKPEPRLHMVAVISCQEAHRAIAIGDKFSGNIAGNVVLLIVRILLKSVEEVPCTVPRRSDSFQEDLFPDTRAETPAMSAEEFEAGKVCDPILVSLRDYVPQDVSPSTLSRSTTMSRKATELRSSSSKIARPTGGTVDLKDQLLDLMHKVERLQERVDKLEGK